MYPGMNTDHSVFDFILVNEQYSPLLYWPSFDLNTSSFIAFFSTVISFNLSGFLSINWTSQYVYRHVILLFTYLRYNRFIGMLTFAYMFNHSSFLTYFATIHWIPESKNSFL